MAIICRDYTTMDACAHALRSRKLPHQLHKRSGDFGPNTDATTLLPLHVSKGLEFSVVALPGVGNMPAPGEDKKEAARVFYVAATKATQRLVIGVGGNRGFATRLVETPASKRGD